VVGTPLKTPKLDCTGGLIQRSKRRDWYTPGDATNVSSMTTPLYGFVQAYLECDVVLKGRLPTTVGSPPIEVMKQLGQNKSFSPNWTTRGKFVDQTQSPKVGLPTVVSTGTAPAPVEAGGAKKCQFQMLNASARNWKVYFSVM